jgi:Rad3-related DNA helicase
MIMITDSLLPEPSALGLPERFTQWRPGQESAALRAVESASRFVVLALPTGSGKSLAYLAAAMLAGGRTAFLTSTKGLQGQLDRDFKASGLYDIRGQNNYPCLYEFNDRVFADPVCCDEGPCHGGVKCELKDSGCTYFDAVRGARAVNLVSTNYSYWMHQNEHGGGLGRFDMLVLDEAHDAIDQLSNHLAVELHPNDMELLGEDFNQDLMEFSQWRTASRVWLDRARTQREDLEASYGEWADRQAVREIRQLKNLERKLARLASAQGDWVLQIARRGPWGSLVARFDPVWPADYAESVLFCGIKKIVLTSATIRPKTLELLGVKQSEVDFCEYPSSFPINRRPVYFVPSVRMDKRATPEHMKAWISKIDAIIRTRIGTKGIIHAVSYQRAQWITRNSEYGDRMLVHTTTTAAAVISRFKQADPPAILVSPSVSMGFDFPGPECRWQILCKVPFPDSRDLVTQARSERDKEYAMYLTMQQIVQMAGRSTRSQEDWSEVFIVDSHFGEWFWSKYRKFAPNWFAESVKFVNVIPKPFEKVT